MSGRVIVVGSINVDLVTRVARLPGEGETVGDGIFGQHHGGKAANQAVAAQRLGAQVEFVGAVGSDPFGESAAAALAAEGVGTTELRRIDDVPTGVALILVGSRGENMIAVAPGANGAVGPADVTASLARLAVGPDDVVLVSHEIATAAARAGLLAARRAGARSIFNPAPAALLDRSTFGLADVLTPNRTELAILVSDESGRVGRINAAGEAAERQARALLETNAEGEGPAVAVVVTLGPAGALVVERAGHDPRVSKIPALRALAVDTTGAGDAFNGALAQGMLSGLALQESVRRAVVAAGLATLQPGAREGMPTGEELSVALG